MQNLKYTFEEILEVTGGYEYYSHNQLMCIYYHSNGLIEEAKEYRDLYDSELKLIKENADKMKKKIEEEKEEEIKKDIEK
jgi:hypothetical protein